MSEVKHGSMLDADDHVAVVETETGFAVAFDYDRELVRRMHDIPGAQFNGESQDWSVPRTSEVELAGAIPSLRADAASIKEDKEQIFALATKTASERQLLVGAAASILPKVSTFLNESNYGEIINVNRNFAAQLTGFGKDDQAAFVTIHRTADLNQPVFKGDDLRIKYNDRGVGDVTPHVKAMSAEEISKKFDSELGATKDGVTVIQDADKFRVAFAFNPALKNRLQRIDGVQMNKETKEFEVPLDKREFLVRAVGEMRSEFRAEQSERAQLQALAESKVDSPKVSDAFTKDGIYHSGKIIGLTPRFAMQFGDRGDIKLHRTDALSAAVEVGDIVKIAYDKSRGTVSSKSLNNSTFVADPDTEKKALALLAADKSPETGTSIGKVVGVDAERGLIFQSVGRGKFDVHLSKHLSDLPKLGESISVTYKNGVAAVQRQEKDQSKSLGR